MEPVNKETHEHFLFQATEKWEEADRQSFLLTVKSCIEQGVGAQSADNQANRELFEYIAAVQYFEALKIAERYLKPHQAIDMLDQTLGFAPSITFKNAESYEPATTGKSPIAKIHKAIEKKIREITERGKHRE